jgi:pimeloyl-ACP methyl ester carboxylesterase
MTTLNIDIAALRELANNDPEFRLAARYWTATVVMEIGAARHEIVIRDGAITGIGPADQDSACDILVAGSEAQWEKLLAAVPPPWYQEFLFAGFRVEGDLIGAVAPYYPALRRLVVLLREQTSGPTPQPAIADTDRRFDTAVGRYVYLRIGGVQYRVYFEEAGAGIPLVLQHTAGADSRQWRHLLEDPGLQTHFRMIAYDLPFHGRSLPPTSLPWWQEEYRLTRAFLMETVIAISRALELERPVYMGCSVGGHLALDLAYYHPEAFEAVIGINAGLHTPVYDEKMWDSWYHPRVSLDWVATTMFSGMSPLSPEAYRREIAWIYSQGGPAVFKGDTRYYAEEHDLRGLASQIDTAKVGVHLLTGEYDALAREDRSAKIAGEIAGATYTLIAGIGHFAPSENPELFKRYLMPVLEDIRTKRA